jgi:hypothetical protein
MCFGTSKAHAARMFLTADTTAILVADRRAARELAAARRRSLRVERRAVAAPPARIPAPAPAVAMCSAA